MSLFLSSVSDFDFALSKDANLTPRLTGDRAPWLLAMTPHKLNVLVI